MKNLLFWTTILVVALCCHKQASAQQYKMVQATTMMGTKMESTIYVKGPRKRTEGAKFMGMGNDIVTIEQCDLQRKVQLNTKNKMYFIEPFQQNEEVLEENHPVAPTPSVVSNTKGGTINMWYEVNDSGQRKAMYGFTARHIYTVQKLNPSADACMMKDSMLIKTDGWYIDLPRFNCPISYRPVRPPGEKQPTGCMDHFVTHKSGKGKLGFPISVISTIVMKDMHEFQTDLETIEFSTATLDSMLFEIPPGYKEAKSQEELQGKTDVNEMIKNAEKSYKESAGATGDKKPGVIRVAVFAPTGSDQVQAVDLQRHLVQSMTADKVEAVAVSTEEEARKYQCDYALNTAFTNVKAESKMSGVVKAIKKADPNAASNYNIKANLTLKAMSDASVKTVQSVDGKFEGLINEAAGKALDKGCQLVLQAIK